MPRSWAINLAIDKIAMRGDEFLRDERQCVRRIQLNPMGF